MALEPLHVQKPAKSKGTSPAESTRSKREARWRRAMRRKVPKGESRK